MDRRKDGGEKREKVETGQELGRERRCLWGLILCVEPCQVYDKVSCFLVQGGLVVVETRSTSL